MTEIEISTEKEVLKTLIDAVDEIETYTKKVGYVKFEQPLGFFFARVLDNKVTRSKKGKKELDLAITRAAAFIIVTQILFYLILLQETRKNNLDISTIRDTKQIQSLFDEIPNNKNYETIFNARVVELLPEESIAALNHVFKVLLPFQLYRFTSDIIGKIFHGLIPFELRKFLAAYYTSNVVGEFLSYLTIKNADAKIMDPACGSGTLLVNAYRRVKELDQSLSHSQILQNLYGVDISIFAAQLAGINLALQEPMEHLDKCQIAILDAFTLKIKQENEETGIISKVDVLLGNPPFTRGDRIESEYKNFLETHLRNHEIIFDYNKKYLGLYAYFLLDSLRFLKNNGTLAFILPLSTINSLTMKPVLKFLLKRYNFQYFITSDAQVTFSEQCAFKEMIFIARKKEQKSAQKTKFVVLKKKLSRKNYLPLARMIEEIMEDYEDSSIRIRHIAENVLWETIGINWVVYLYNQTFFDTFERIRKTGIISNIQHIVKTPRYDVDRGLRAGISDFFYLPNKYWSIIKESNDWIKIQNIEDSSILKLSQQYLSLVFRKSSLYKRVTPEISEYIVVISNNTTLEVGIKDYIQWGVNKFQKKRGFETLTYKHVSKGRKIARLGITHELSLISSKIIAYYSPNPVIFTDNFIFIRTFDEENDKIIAAYLNSSVFFLTYFVLRREKTGALGQIFGTDVRNFFCLNPYKVTKTDRKELIQIFDRFIIESNHFPSFYHQIQGALKNRNHIRFLLDKKICEILKLTDVPSFMSQLYETLTEELSKFN
ncbi:MAG: HsdM family class I SAM-dependent methyltransferase [Candidatus Hodarchaeales archaeon]